MSYGYLVSACEQLGEAWCSFFQLGVVTDNILTSSEQPSIAQ